MPNERRLWRARGGVWLVAFLFLGMGGLLGAQICAGQTPTPGAGRGAFKQVDYTYNGQKYQLRMIGGEVRQVMQDGKVILMISGGQIIPFPGVDLKVAAGAQDALKAYQAETQPAAGGSLSAGSGNAASGGGQPKSALTVDGVVTMLDAGLSEDLIVEKIHRSGQTFDLSPEEMVRLKKAKASDALIKTMMGSGMAGSGAGGTTTSAPAPAQPTANAAPSNTGDASTKPKKENSLSNMGHDIANVFEGKTVIDKVGLRNILPTWDPEKALAEQFPHVAITVLYAPMGWMDPYVTDKSAQGRSILPSCFKLQAVVWSDAEHSRTVGPFDWCSNKDEMLAALEPDYPYSLMRHRVEKGYITGVNRTDGPAPPETLIPNDRATMDMEAKTNPQGRSIDLNKDAHTRFALMFANVRKDMGETLTSDGDFRVWIVSIKKAAGPSLY